MPGKTQAVTDSCGAQTAQARMTGQIDTQIEIVTPENIAFRYRVAGPFQRLPAYLIDVALRMAVMILGIVAVLWLFGSIGLEEVGMGLWLAIYFAIEWFYGGLFETIWNGQTPGKWLLQLRVISTTGQPITGSQAVLRNLLRPVDAMPSVGFGLFEAFTYQVGFLTAASSARFQRLGDVASGTMVVVEMPAARTGVVSVKDAEVRRLAANLPKNLQLPASVARALSSYVARRQSIAAGRRNELAGYLAEPLRQRLGLGPNIGADQLLCALYQQAFLSDDEPKPVSREVMTPAERELAMSAASEGR